MFLEYNHNLFLFNFFVTNSTVSTTKWNRKLFTPSNYHPVELDFSTRSQFQRRNVRLCRVPPEQPHQLVQGRSCRNSTVVNHTGRVEYEHYVYHSSMPVQLRWCWTVYQNKPQNIIFKYVSFVFLITYYLFFKYSSWKWIQKGRKSFTGEHLNCFRLYMEIIAPR